MFPYCHPYGIAPWSSDIYESKKSISFTDSLWSQDLAHRFSHHHHDRVSAEIYATDSYQNVLFSILHFHTLTSNYPTHITIISHAFKRGRFLELHCHAIRWPLSQLEYIGIDPPESVTPRNVLDQGESEKGYGVWEQDLYGVGSVLLGKREKRGWKACAVEVLGKGKGERIDALLKWKGGPAGKEVYGGKLPWEGQIENIER